MLSKLKSTKCPSGFRTKCPRWKAALIGLLLTLTAITSGCASKSTPQVSPSKLSVDASLMVESNYTQKLLKVLSE
ncbi:o-spanin [Escherichia phage Penshu1]|uniref:O-spanin n=1 Tax=Escherichia phage Penshu1 TaxID=2591101 RepID=A0A5B9NEF5_9CAUD|nr:o-spanin [Escherichia phage Penshu1]